MLKKPLTLALLVVTIVPGTASADWLFTPYMGITLCCAPNTIDTDNFRHVFRKRFNFGGSVAAAGNGFVGFEVDLNYTPDFYQRLAGRLNLPNLESHLTTLMANVVVGVPEGAKSGVSVRPYAAAGLGLLSATVAETADLSTNHLAFNFGGGLHVFFNDRTGVRGDLRYFRNLDHRERESFFGADFGLPDFDYWRATFGVTFRFGD